MGVRSILLDWGDTVMQDFRHFEGPMHLWPEVAATPGVVEALTQLGHGRVIALATNAIDSCEDEIWTALERASLARLFDKIYCFRALGSMKPSLEFYDRILKDLRLNPLDTVMVGDDFEQDILGANRCGIFGIWVNQSSSERRVGKLYDTIYSVSDLPSAIARRETVLLDNSCI